MVLGARGFLLTCTMCMPALAIMQVDVAGSLFPAGVAVGDVQARFTTTTAPAVWREATHVMGPDENFGNWAFVFDYDQGLQVMPPQASQRQVGIFQLILGCPDGSIEVQNWDPEGEMTYFFDVPLPFYTYEMPNFTMHEFSECDTAVEPPPRGWAEELILGAAYPNPSNAMFRIPLVNASMGEVNLELFTALGEKVDSRHFVVSQQQRGVVLLSVEDLESGLYFVRGSNDYKSNVEKIILLK